MAKRFALYLALLLILYAIVVSIMVGDPIFSDFAKFHASAQLYFEGENIYRRIPVDRWLDWPPEWGPKPGPVHPNLNPPFFTLLLFPLAPFDFAAAYWIWTALSLGAGMAAMAWIESATRSREPELHRQLGFQLLLLAYFPTFINIQYGQVSLFLLLLTTGAWVAAREGRGGRAGLWLGLALSIKPFFALFGLFFLVRRRWRVLLTMGAVFALSIGLSMAVFGLDTLLDYRRQVGQVTWAGTNWNASFLGIATRLLGGSESAPLWEQPELGRLLAAVASVGAAMAMAILTWPSARRPGQPSFDSGFALTLAFMLLISPLGWLYYFPVLLLSFVVAWERPRRWTRGLLVVAFVLSTLPIPLWSMLHAEEPSWHWPIWSSFPSVALLLLAGILSVQTWMENRPADLRTGSV